MRNLLLVALLGVMGTPSVLEAQQSRGECIKWHIWGLICAEYATAPLPVEPTPLAPPAPVIAPEPEPVQAPPPPPPPPMLVDTPPRVTTTAARQPTYTTFTHGRVTREQFAQAIRADQRSVLRLPAERIVTAANRTYSMNYTRAQWADFIAQMEVAPCLDAGQATTRLLRVHRAQQAVDLNGWTRNLRPGELCLWADNRAYFSLDCGNITPDLIRTVSAPVVRSEPIGAPWVAPQPSYVTRVDTVVVQQYQPQIPIIRERRRTPWGWILGPPIVAGAGYAACRLLTDWCDRGSATAEVDREIDIKIDIGYWSRGR
jgi:hypothetical protein